MPSQHVGGGGFPRTAGLVSELIRLSITVAVAFRRFPRPVDRRLVQRSALLITMLVTVVLVRGVRESAGTNTVMVAIKIAAILIFCIARRAHQTRQLAPFAPHGFPGILTGASIVSSPTSVSIRSPRRPRNASAAGDLPSASSPR